MQQIVPVKDAKNVAI